MGGVSGFLFFLSCIASDRIADDAIREQAGKSTYNTSRYTPNTIVVL